MARTDSDTFSRTHSDMFWGYHYWIWARAHQARMRQVAAEERPARQVRPPRRAGLFAPLVALLTAVWRWPGGAEYGVHRQGERP